MASEKVAGPSSEPRGKPRVSLAGKQGDSEPNKNPAEVQDAQAWEAEQRAIYRERRRLTQALYRRESRRLAQTLGRMDDEQLAQALPAEQRAIARKRRRLAQALGRTDNLAEVISIIAQADALAARAITLRLWAEKRALRMWRSAS
jgi:hypothetical protein